MEIQIIPCLQDNYAYLIIDKTKNIACVIDPGEAEPIIKYLKDKNIQTRLFFYPLHMQPCYDGKYNVGSYDLSESLYDRGISLPSSVKLKWKDQKYIIKTIKSYFGE